MTDAQPGDRPPIYEIGNYGADKFEIQITEASGTRRFAVAYSLADAERMVDAFRAWDRAPRSDDA